MTITLNHTIVPARDKVAAARFFADIFGRKPERRCSATTNRRRTKHYGRTGTSRQCA